MAEIFNALFAGESTASIIEIIEMIFDMIKKAVLELFDEETGYTTEEETTA